MVERTTFSRREVNRTLLAAAFGLLSADKGTVKGGVALTMPLFDFAIAGGFNHGLRERLADLHPGMNLSLRREPDNPHDADAVAVLDRDGLMLGYVPRIANTPIARLLDEGGRVRAEIVSLLMMERAKDIPNDLVFTSFTTGDPMIRLTSEGHVDPLPPRTI